MTHCELCLQPRSHEENNLASDLKEEMQPESESSIAFCELLPRDGPINYGRYDLIP